MQVECNFFGPLREVVGEKTIVRECSEGESVSSLLSALEAEYPGFEGDLLADTGEVSSGVSITVNGKNVAHLDGGQTTLEDGDVVRASPPIVGG